MTRGQSSKDEVAKPDSVCMNLEEKPSTSVLVFLAEALTEFDRNLQGFPNVCNQFWDIYEQNPWTKLGKETVQNGNIKTLFYCLQTTTVFFYCGSLCSLTCNAFKQLPEKSMFLS